MKMTALFTIDEVKDIIKDALEKAYKHFKQGNLNEAEMLYRQVLKVHPEEYIALHMLGLVAHRTGNNDEAVELMEKALSLEPDKWEIYNNLAAAYIGLGNNEKAIEYLENLKAKDPKNIHAYNNLGLTYQSLRKFKEAELNLTKGIKLHPKEAHLYFNLGNIYADQLELDKAIEQFRKCLETNKDFTPALWNLSSSLLLNGQWEEGWKAYEARWEQFEVFKKGKEKYDQSKAWDGKKDLKNKKILLYSEQGVGDTFHFIRYARKLKNMGAHVIMECPNHSSSDIISLMENQQYIDEVFLHTDEKPEHDYNQPITSFPYVFNTTLEDNLWDGVYIKPTSSKVIPDKKWDDYKDFFKIGICWAGNVIHQRDCDRSCYLKYFKQLEAIDGVKLFSLQKDTRKRVWPSKGEVDLTEDTEGMKVVDMSPYLNDFNETANVIKNMDLVISVDTAIAHLAGAMGKEVWTLLAYVPDWRWLLSAGNKSPWYPTMKLYRQPKWDDWKSVFDKLENDVKAKT